MAETLDRGSFFVREKAKQSDAPPELCYQNETVQEAFAIPNSAWPSSGEDERVC